MTARGRQYYDPEIQTNRFVPGEQDLERIEVFPVGEGSTARLPQEIGKWASRRVDGGGRIVEQGDSDFQQQRVVELALGRWPTLQVYVLNSEIEDSTWEGTGPSPRLWGAPAPQPFSASGVPGDPPTEDLSPAREETEEAVAIRALAAPAAGSYVLIEDIVVLLESYAQQYDDQGNPSGALALREAAAALKETT